MWVPWQQTVFRLQWNSTAYMKFICDVCLWLCWHPCVRSTWLVEIASSRVICQCQIGAEDETWRQCGGVEWKRMESSNQIPVDTPAFFFAGGCVRRCKHTQPPTGLWVVKPLSRSVFKCSSCMFWTHQRVQSFQYGLFGIQKQTKLKRWIRTTKHYFVLIHDRTDSRLIYYTAFFPLFKLPSAIWTDSDYDPAQPVIRLSCSGQFLHWRLHTVMAVGLHCDGENICQTPAEWFKGQFI